MIFACVTNKQKRVPTFEDEHLSCLNLRNICEVIEKGSFLVICYSQGQRFVTLK